MRAFASIMDFSQSALFFLTSVSGFQARSQNCEKRSLASSRPSFRMEQLGSHWTDFDET
jgi:hypothetical protein